MRTLKKTLCLVLALVLVLGTLGVAASAKTAYADFTDKDEIQYKEAVEVLNALGILIGRENGNFDPKAVVNRAEAAKIVAYMYLGETAADLLKADVDPFTDVPKDTWFAGYVAFCVKEGIINGRGDGTFGPADPVTAIEFAKMLLVAAGYGVQNEFIGNGWATEVAKLAINKKVFEGNLGADFNKGATREEAALYAFNALTKVLTVSWIPYLGDYLYDEVDDDELGFVSGAEFYKDQVQGNTLGWEYYQLWNAFGEVAWCGEHKNIELQNDGAYLSLKGLCNIFDAGLEAYVWVIGNKILTGPYYTDTLTSETYDYKYDGKCDEYWYNGATISKANFEYYLDRGTYVAVYKEIDGDIKAIALDPSVAQVGSNGVKTLVPNSGTGKGKTYVTIDGFCTNELAAELNGYEVLAKGDVFTYLPMADGVTYFEKVAGTAADLTKQTKAATVLYPTLLQVTDTIGDAEFVRSDLYGADTTIGNVDIFGWLQPNLPVKGLTYYLDRGGYVIWAEPAAAPKAPESKYFVVLDAGYSIDTALGGNGFAAEAKIVNTDGTVETIKTDLFYGDKALLSAYLCDCNIKIWGREIWNSSDAAKLFGGNFIGQWVKGTPDKDGVYTLEDAGYASYYEEFINGSAFVAKGGNLGDDDTIFLVQTGKEEFTVYTGINAVPTMKAPLVDIALFVDESPDVDLVYIPQAYTGTTESFFVLDNTPVEKTSVKSFEGKDVTVFGVKVWNEAKGEFLVFMDEDVYEDLAFSDDFEMPNGCFIQNATFNEFGYLAGEGAYKYDIAKDYAIWGWAKVIGAGNNTIADIFGHVANVANTKVFLFDVFTNTITAGTVADLKEGVWFCADTEYNEAAHTWTPGVIFVAVDTEIPTPDPIVP